MPQSSALNIVMGTLQTVNLIFMDQMRAFFWVMTFQGMYCIHLQGDWIVSSGC